MTKKQMNRPRRVLSGSCVLLAGASLACLVMTTARAAVPARIEAIRVPKTPGHSQTVGQHTNLYLAANRTASDDSEDSEGEENRPGDRTGEQKEGPTVELEEITVTATGRPQSAIEVPYNISVVTGRQIRRNHIRSKAELFRSIPGINVVDSGPRNRSVVNMIRIRGVNVDSSALGDYPVSAVSPVATYVNMVPIYANFLLFDIKRVEVLRGPQGTLYGSGSLSGTVRYILNPPELNRFYGNVSTSFSSVKYSSSIGNSTSVVLNLPVTNEFAIRLNVKRNDYPGVTDYVNLYKLNEHGVPVAPEGVLSPEAVYYRKEDADTVLQKYGRIALLWKPNDDLDISFNYLVQRDEFGARRGMALGTNGAGEPYGRDELGAVILEPAERQVYLGALEVNLDLGFATLTSSTSYFDEDGRIVSDNTGFYAQNHWLENLYYNYPRPLAKAVRTYGDRAFTQEFRLVSEPGGSFDYIVGLFYRNQHNYGTQDSYLVGFQRWWNAAFPAYKDSVINNNDFHYLKQTHYETIALYGQGTWHVTPDLQFTLGVRTFTDEFSATLDQHTALWTAFYSSSHSSSTQETSRTLFLGNMSWWFSDTSQLYATISQGYRHGGANGVPTTGHFAEDPAWLYYEPDTVVNYEIGLKGFLADNLTYSASLYYVDWDNPQINTATTNWGFFAVQNLSHAVSKGLELQIQGHVGSLEYGFGYAYTDAYLTEDAYTADGQYLINDAGTTLPGTSQHRLNGYAAYSFNAGPGRVRLQVDASYQSESQNSISESPLFDYTLPSFTIWNATASYSTLNWTTILWIKNITNEKGITGVYTIEYMGTSPEQHFFGNDAKAIVTLPRTIGVTLTYRF